MRVMLKWRWINRTSVLLYHELYVHLNQIINSVFVTISVFMESMIQNIQIYSLSTLPDAMQSILNRAVLSNFKSRSNSMPVLKTAGLSQNSTKSLIWSNIFWNRNFPATLSLLEALLGLIKLFKIFPRELDRPCEFHIVKSKVDIFAVGAFQLKITSLRTENEMYHSALSVKINIFHWKIKAKFSHGVKKSTW